MKLSDVYLSTVIPLIPSILNKNNAEIQRNFDLIYDSSLGVIIVPVNTAGKIKGSTGEFSTVITNNLITRTSGYVDGVIIALSSLTHLKSFGK